MTPGKQLNDNMRQIGFVILLVAMLCMIIYQLNYFLSTILGSFTLYLLLRKTQRRLLKKGWHKLLATSLLLTMTVLIVFVLGGAFLGTVFAKVKDFHPQIVIDNVNAIHDTIMDRFGYDIFSKDIADKVIRGAGGLLPGIFSITGSIITNGMMIIFVLFFMLNESEKMEAAIENMLPLSKNSIALLKKEAQNMVVSNAVGIPVIMIGQGLAAGLAYWVLGAGDPLVWGLLTGVFGLIPVIGTAAIWLPLSINLLINGMIWQGIALIIYGAAIIASVDNLFRMVFMKKYADVHPLITIFGIILGMNLFGFWGIIFGPLLLSGFLLLVKIYHNEFLGK